VDWGLGLGPNPQSPINYEKNTKIMNYNFYCLNKI